MLARRGHYLLQPRAGFVPGYDFVGTVETATSGTYTFEVGQRVAGILPRMGSHTSLIAVHPSLLVTVPDGLDSAVAATIPLDGVTARLALEALRSPREPAEISRLGAAEGPTRRTILVQGAGGSLGAWSTQLAQSEGHLVFGTASNRSRAIAEDYGVRVFDYTDPAWVSEVAAQTGGVHGVIDHTGNRTLARMVRPGGVIVRTAFEGAHTHPRIATASGFARASARRYARPGERVISTPITVALRRGAYRRHLREMLELVDTGILRAPAPTLVAFDDYPTACTEAERAVPGTKVVLAMAQ